MTRTPISRSKGQRSTYRGQGILRRPPAQLVGSLLLLLMGIKVTVAPKFADYRQHFHRISCTDCYKIWYTYAALRNYQSLPDTTGRPTQTPATGTETQSAKRYFCACVYSFSKNGFKDPFCTTAEIVSVKCRWKKPEYLI